ncbi:hypothetical protein OG21DRAFT_1524510 [Imleria badia]|nr:hypothetical protein OG21DRAFT_1524510 [Imleria badia]
MNHEVIPEPINISLGSLDDNPQAESLCSGLGNSDPIVHDDDADKTLNQSEGTITSGFTRNDPAFNDSANKMDQDDHENHSEDVIDDSDTLDLIPAFTQVPALWLLYLQVAIAHIMGSLTVSQATDQLHDGLDLIALCGTLPTFPVPRRSLVTVKKDLGLQVYGLIISFLQLHFPELHICDDMTADRAGTIIFANHSVKVLPFVVKDDIRFGSAMAEQMSSDQFAVHIPNQETPFYCSAIQRMVYDEEIPLMPWDFVYTNEYSMLEIVPSPSLSYVVTVIPIPLNPLGELIKPLWIITACDHNGFDGDEGWLNPELED